MKFLSYPINSKTPSYGNRNTFTLTKKSDIAKGNVANDSFIETTVHIGTHIDMPYHFYSNGQTIEDFKDSYWEFKNTLIINIEPKELVIKDELLEKLHFIDDIGYELLIVKTGICNIRESDKFWEKNFGFHPDIYDYLVLNFPKIRVFGFDSISVSSFTNRLVGRESHKRFLNPKRPILLLEDMDLRDIDENTNFDKIIIAPLRIEKTDGLPCSVIGLYND